LQLKALQPRRKTKRFWIFVANGCCAMGSSAASEAARHLPEDLAALAPEIPWKEIRGIGNILRHEYHKTSDAIVWAVVMDHLPPLEAATKRLLSSLDKKTEDRKGLALLWQFHRCLSRNRMRQCGHRSGGGFGRRAAMTARLTAGRLG
jgi:Protein of unknown function DUF86